VAATHFTSFPPSEFPQDIALDNQALEEAKRELGPRATLSDLLTRAQQIKEQTRKVSR